MDAWLTEESIRQRANEQSFLRCLNYFQAGAIVNPTWQSVPGEITLMAFCDGSSNFSYRLSVKLNAKGIVSAICNCPYTFGGDCKHIVALLLTYLNQPETFVEEKSLAELLFDLDKGALTALITRLVERDPVL